MSPETVNGVQPTRTFFVSAAIDPGRPVGGGDVDAFRRGLPQSKEWSEVWTSDRRPGVILSRFQVRARDGDEAFQVILRNLELAGAEAGVDARPVEIVWYPASRNDDGTRRWTAPTA